MKFKDLSIKWKIAGGFGILVFVMFSLGIYNFQNFKFIKNNQNRISSSMEILSETMKSKKKIMDADMLAQRWVTLVANEKAVLLLYLLADEENEDELQGLFEQLGKLNKEIPQTGETLSLLVQSKKMKVQIQSIQRVQEATYQAAVAVISTFDDMEAREFGEATRNKVDRFVLQIKLLEDKVMVFQNLLNKEVEKQDQRQFYTLKSIREKVIESINVISSSVLLSGIAIGISLIIAIVVAYLVIRSIIKPITKVVEMITEMSRGNLNNRLKIEQADEIGQMAKAMDDFADSLQIEVVNNINKLAKGDLTFNVQPRSDKDVIGKALANMCMDLNIIMTQVNNTTVEIALASGQISDTGLSLSQGATEQASSLEEITCSMEEMGTRTWESSGNADQANQLVVQTRSAAEKGNSQMQEMVNSMSEINESSQSISNIIKVIDEIAFQTNMLALNAAVEAARAGKHGKGFAVVAEEVRNLAARSAKAAKETEELIESSINKVNNGSEIARKTEEALNEIVLSITKVADLVSEISVSAKEQAEGIGQVNTSLCLVGKVTQKNASTSEESAATSEELAVQANYLKETLTHFKLKDQELIQVSDKSVMQAKKPVAAISTYEVYEEETLDSPRKTKVIKPGDMIVLNDKEFGKY